MFLRCSVGSNFSYFDDVVFEMKMRDIHFKSFQFSKFNHKKEIATAATVSIILTECNRIVEAAPKDLNTYDIEHMLDPLIRMLQRFSYPVAAALSIIGCLMITMGNADGKERIKSAIIGLILAAIIPIILSNIYHIFY